MATSVEAIHKRLAEFSVIERIDKRINDGITAGHEHEHVYGHVVILFAGKCQEVDDEWQPANVEPKA